MSNDLVESNYEQVILDLLARVKRLEGGSVVAQELSEISSDMGLIEGGELRIHSDWADPKEPGDGFSGVRILGAFEYPKGSGTYYAIVGVNNDALTFGLSSVDGSAIFCSGNATIDQDGISGTDLLKWMITQTATVGSNSRIGRLGFRSDGTDPLWTIQYQNTATSEQITNGGFESDYSNWTKTTETGTSWQIGTMGAHGGSKYSIIAIAVANTTDTGVLTSDRIAVTALSSYLTSAYIWINGLSTDSDPGNSSNVKIEVKWYDHASAGSLLSTDTLTSFEITSEFYWTQFAETFIAPTGALSAAIVITATATADADGNLNFVAMFDDISFSGVDPVQELQLTDDGLATTNGMFPYQITLFPYQCYAAYALDYVVATGQPFNYVAYITTASLANGNTYTYYFNAEKGTYTMKYLYAKSTAGGKADIYIDDVKVVSLLEHYAASATYNQLSTTASISITFSGRHELKLVVNGKHASSSNYALYHTSIALIRTGA